MEQSQFALIPSYLLSYGDVNVNHTAKEHPECGIVLCNRPYENLIYSGWS